jgi:hypothetical protein
MKMVFLILNTLWLVGTLASGALMEIYIGAAYVKGAGLGVLIIVFGIIVYICNILIVVEMKN